MNAPHRDDGFFTEALASRDTGGVALRRLCGGADGSCRPDWELGEALSRAVSLPALVAGIHRASRRGDCHGLSALLGGGARGGCPGSKVSMTIMRPPQHEQARALIGGSSGSAVWIGLLWRLGRPSSCCRS